MHYYKGSWGNAARRVIPIVSEDRNTSCVLYLFEDKPDTVFISELYIGCEDKETRKNDLHAFIKNLFPNKELKNYPNE